MTRRRRRAPPGARPRAGPPRNRVSRHGIWLGRGRPEFRVGGEERCEEGVVDRVGKVGDAKSFAKRTDVVETGRVRSAAVVVADRDGVPGGHTTHAWDGQQVRLRQPEAAERDDDVLRVLGCMRRGRRCGRAATWLAVPAARGCGDTGLRSELLRKAEREDQGNDTEHRCLQVISSVSCTNAF